MVYGLWSMVYVYVLCGTKIFYCIFMYKKWNDGILEPGSASSESIGMSAASSMNEVSQYWNVGSGELSE